MSINNDLVKALAAVLPGKIAVAGGETYAASNDSYFSAFEADITPSCIAQPTSAEDVAKLVKALRPALANGRRGVAAIRGGGNMAWPGSANVEGGVTIDMRGLQGVKISADKKIVSVGAGETWGTVYEAIEKHGITVAGGRVNRLGAVGFMLGGGLSYFSVQRGFTCDTVVGLELVLASGEIVQANRTVNSDLYRAVLGGSNNLAIVTRFEMEAFEPPAQIFGGRAVTTLDNIEKLFTALYDTASGEMEGSEDAHVIWAVGHTTGMELAVTQIFDLKGRNNSLVLKPYIDLEPKIEQATTLRLGTHADFREEQSLGYNPRSRCFHITTTIRPSVDLFRAIYQRFKETQDLLKKTVADLSYFLVMQPLNVEFLRKSCEQWPAGSHNSQGLKPEDGPLLTVLIFPAWSSPADDSLMFSEAERLMADIQNIADSMGLLHRYIFPNHAWGRQNVVGGFGPERLAEMRKAQVKWDPEEFFQTVVGGGFKMPRK